MTLKEKQIVFAKYFALLISWINSQPGYQCTIGEVERTQMMQDYYVKTGKSKTKNSFHLYNLAGDIRIYKDGVFLTESAYYKFAGDYWKSIDPKNVWGGDWGWDGNHFQYDNIVFE